MSIPDAFLSNQGDTIALTADDKRVIEFIGLYHPTGVSRSTLGHRFQHCLKAACLKPIMTKLANYDVISVKRHAARRKTIPVFTWGRRALAWSGKDSHEAGSAQSQTT